MIAIELVLYFLGLFAFGVMGIVISSDLQDIAYELKRFNDREEKQ